MLAYHILPYHGYYPSIPFPNPTPKPLQEALPFKKEKEKKRTPNLLLRIRILLGQMILTPIHPLTRTHTRRQRRQTPSPQQLQRTPRTLPLEKLRQPLLPLLPNPNQLLHPRLPDQLLARRRLTSHTQQAHHIALRHKTQLRIRAAGIALPVWVLGDITRGESNRVDEGKWFVGSWRWIAELGVEGDTVGAGRIDGEEATDGLPDTSGLDSVFLRGSVRRVGVEFGVEV